MLSSDEIHGMLVNQLKEELKLRGASTIGKKAELATRLEELVAQESQGNNNANSEPTDGTATENQVAEVVEETVVDDSVGVTVKQSIPAVVETKIALEESKDVVPDQSSADESNIVNNENEIAVEASTADKIGSDGYTHVRIDNFQRPLNQKALVEWIESQCQCVLAADAVWINTIKTHCYVDFATEEEAKRCVENVTGKKFPASSPYILEADFTSVSAKEAPQSAEGSLKPGAWKVVPGVSLPASPKVVSAAHTQSHAQSSGRTITIDTEAMDTHDDTAAEEALTSSNKRKLDDTAGSPTTDTPSNKNRRVAGLDIFRRATAGILLTRPSGSGVYEAPTGNTQAPVVTGFVSRKGREEDTTELGETSTSESATTRTSDAASLEDLFRKTTTTTPALYWLPAPDEVVQQRLKSRLLLSRGPRR